MNIPPGGKRLACGELDEPVEVSIKLVGIGIPDKISVQGVVDDATGKGCKVLAANHQAFPGVAHYLPVALVGQGDRSHQYQVCFLVPAGLIQATFQLGSCPVLDQKKDPEVTSAGQQQQKGQQ